MSERADTAIQGGLGLAVNVMGVITSLQQDIEFYTRMASLLVGIAVGGVTIWSIIKKANK